MTSNDLIILEAINGLEGKIVALQSDVNGIKQEIQEIKTEIREIKYENLLNSAKIEWLQHSIYWGFGIIAFIVAYVSLFKKDKPEAKTERKDSPTLEEVKNLIDATISKALVRN